MYTQTALPRSAEMKTIGYATQKSEKDLKKSQKTLSALYTAHKLLSCLENWVQISAWLYCILEKMATFYPAIFVSL